MRGKCQLPRHCAFSTGGEAIDGEIKGEIKTAVQDLSRLVVGNRRLDFAVCFAVNCLVDPLWYLRGNVLTHINYPFNERLAGIIRFMPRLEDYDCVIFGTSRASLLPEEKIEGYRCYNLSISDGNARGIRALREVLAGAGLQAAADHRRREARRIYWADPAGRGAGLCPHRIPPPSIFATYLSTRCARFLDPHAARRRTAPSLL